MALDTKYRPRRYADVLGQDATVAVLREFVRSGQGFQQSYLFCGPHGNGKTTLGRILARAMLCENPQEGEACDQCSSCRSILDRGSNECFSEMDAATKSGKVEIIRITEELEFSTFSGNRRIYLFDEAHQLTKQALDALLKPMEDFVHGTEDRKLVCIFCTTEPERMKDTVFSRCAPAFSIRINSPDKIAERLAWVCDQEGIQYEPQALVTIAAATECHIRDAFMAVDAVSKLGAVNDENITRYLRLDINVALLKILAYLGSDLDKALLLVDEVCESISPTSAYERLTQAAMLSYKAHLGVIKAPPHWQPHFVKRLGEQHREFLLACANCFASRPGRPTPAMLSLDVAQLHQMRSGTVLQIASGPTTVVHAPAITIPAEVQVPDSTPEEPVAVPEVQANGTSTPSSEESEPSQGNVETEALGDMDPSSSAPQSAYETPDGVYVDPRAVKKRKKGEGATNSRSPQALDPERFRDALGMRVAELRTDAGDRGSAGRYELGGGRTDPIGGGSS